MHTVSEILRAAVKGAHPIACFQRRIPAMKSFHIPYMPGAPRTLPPIALRGRCYRRCG